MRPAPALRSNRKDATPPEVISNVANMQNDDRKGDLRIAVAPEAQKAPAPTEDTNLLSLADFGRPHRSGPPPENWLTVEIQGLKTEIRELTGRVSDLAEGGREVAPLEAQLAEAQAELQDLRHQAAESARIASALVYWGDQMGALGYSYDGGFQDEYEYEADYEADYEPAPVRRRASTINAIRFGMMGRDHAAHPHTPPQTQTRRSIHPLVIAGGIVAVGFGIHYVGKMLEGAQAQAPTLNPAPAPQTMHVHHHHHEDHSSHTDHYTDVAVTGPRGLRGGKGAAGNDGAPGQDGQATQAQVRALMETMAHDFRGPSGVDGLDGSDGRDGRNGRDGNDGQDGRKGRDGNNGRDGRKGRDGSDGRDGRKGRDGKDGKSRKGRDGRDGSNGRDGKDGKSGSGKPQGKFTAGPKGMF